MTRHKTFAVVYPENIPVGSRFIIKGLLRWRCYIAGPYGDHLDAKFWRLSSAERWLGGLPQQVPNTGAFAPFLQEVERLGMTRKGASSGQGSTKLLPPTTNIEARNQAELIGGSVKRPVKKLLEPGLESWRWPVKKPRKSCRHRIPVASLNGVHCALCGVVLQGETFS